MQNAWRAASDKASIAERGVAWLRLAVILLNTAIYVAWPHPFGIPWLAGATILVAFGYSAFVLLRPRHPNSALSTAVWTATTDAILIGTWLASTGGAASIFYPLWGLSIIAIAFRFSARTTRLTTVGYVLADAALLAAWGQLTWAPEVMVRLGYLAILGTLGSFVAASNLMAWQRKQELESAMADAERQHGDIRAIMNAAPFIIIRTDLEGKIQYINRVAEGYTADQVRGASLLAFVPEQEHEKLTEAMAKVQANELPVNYEIETQTPAGDPACYRSVMAPVHQHDVLTGLVVVTHDVTQERQQALDHEKARTAAAEVDRLEKQDAFRQQLLNSVAHELNTPLTPLRLQLAVLERMDVKGVALMRRNVERLANLVGDLLDVSKVENRVPLRRESLEVGGLITEVVDTFQPLAARRRIRLEALPSLAKMDADPLRVVQVLNNLVSNAIRFSPDETRIEIGATVEDFGCRLYVKDEGLGLDQAEKERVLRPFEQVHKSLEEDMPGTGLGLHITQEILKAHGGTIEVHSEGRGRGTRVDCLFPRFA